MCGIAGFAGSIFSQEDLQKHIKHACQVLRHRGPDQTGVHVDKGLVLGVSRLAIRDPNNGMQPMTRRGMTLIFNGELYDTKPLKDNLLKAGYSFETESDTEILLNAFLEFGVQIVKDLAGMFAFALWDAHSKSLYLGRDRWGEKPLYYTYGEGFLAFASEIKALKVWPNIEWDISLQDIRIFLRHSYLPNPRTGWKKVFKLKQGSILTWQESKLSISRYFCPLIEKRKLNEGNEKQSFGNRSSHLAENLFSLLASSVKSCTVSDRPIGVFLSGGIDSTTIACLASQFQPDIPVFSLYWDDRTYTEEYYIKEAARALKLNHYAIKCDPPFFLNYFESIVKLYDEPFADESMIPTHCLARFAKEKVDVVLTGDGADEFFHGYERYFFQGSFEKYLDVFAATSNDLLKLICHPNFNDMEEEESLFLDQYHQAKKSYIQENRLKSWVDINTYLTDDILMKIDRACMGVSLEPRAPFLTPQVTNFALNCSEQELVGKGTQGKEILRKAMKGHLPKLFLERKKKGFGVPLHQWFQSSLREWMTQRLFEGKLLKTGWVSQKGVENLITAKENHSRTIFNLLVLEAWLQNNT